MLWNSSQKGPEPTSRSIQSSSMGLSSCTQNVPLGVHNHRPGSWWRGDCIWEMGEQSYRWSVEVKTGMSTCMGVSTLALWAGAEGGKGKLAGQLD